MEFFNSAVDVLKTLVVALGAGLGVWAQAGKARRLKKAGSLYQPESLRL